MLTKSLRRSKRVARSLDLYSWGRMWTLAAYCELRRDFRNFLLDRSARSRVTKSSPSVTLDDFVRAITAAS
jgi:predicted DNA-binding transcriptional regulator YafY